MASSRTDKRRVPLELLVKRRCLCTAGTCYTQFANAADMGCITESRAMLETLSPAERDIHLEMLFMDGSVTQQRARQTLAASHERVDGPAGELLIASDGEPEELELLRTSGAESIGSSEHNAEPPAKRRKAYAKRKTSRTNAAEFAGRPVCQRALQGLLGVGTSTLQRIRHGQRRMSRSEPMHPRLGFSMILKQWHKWPSVLLFLWMVYHSAAEGLPDHVIRVSNLLDSPFKREDDIQRAVQGAVLDLATYGRDPRAWLTGPGYFDGPRRYLQHGKPIQLYWEYVGTMGRRGQRAASLSTFLRVLHKVFKQHLGFRKPNQHAQCTICSGLKRDIKESKNMLDRQYFLGLYLEHILSQWQDRMVWWSLCELSVTWMEASIRIGSRMASAAVGSSLISIIIDGMDQAKFAVPRLRHRDGRAPKALDNLHRPRLHIAAIWVLGCVLRFSVSDEDLKKDSNTQCELLSRTLQDVFDRHGTLPLGLHIQQDNTCREGKNQQVLRWCMLLVLAGTFRWISMGFLRTGHSLRPRLTDTPNTFPGKCVCVCSMLRSPLENAMCVQTRSHVLATCTPGHENVDQVFAQVVSLLVGSTFDTPDDLVELLIRFCRGPRGGPPGLTHAIAGKVDETAEWQDWGNRVACRITGHAQRGAPHYFRIARREDVGSFAIDGQGHHHQEERFVEVTDFPEGAPRSPDDIMLVVKHRLADTRPTQVIAVCPAWRRATVLERGLDPVGVAARRPISAELAENIRKYAPALQQQGFISDDAAAYLVGWVNGTLPRLSRPRRFSWMSYCWRDGAVEAPPRIIRHYDGQEVYRGVKVAVQLRDAQGRVAPAGPDDERDGEDLGLVVPLAM